MAEPSLDDDFDFPNDAQPSGRRRLQRFESFEAFSTDDLEAAAMFNDPLPAGAYSGGSRQPRQRASVAAVHCLQRHERLEEAIRQRLKAGGYDVTYRGDALVVDSKIVGSNLRRRMLRHRDDRDVLHDDNAFADVVHRYLFDVLKHQAKAQLRKHSRNAYLKQRSDGPGSYVMQATRQIATVTAASFVTVSGEYVRGPFWAPGEHWEAARTLLLPRSKRSSPELPPPRPLRPSTAATQAAPTAPTRQQASQAKESERDRFINWPDGAARSLKRLACAASPMLREHRLRADEDPV